MHQFTLKQEPKDFIVREDLGRYFDNKPVYTYLLTQKIGHNTLALIQKRTNDLGLPKNSFSVAGLKDKDAITSQRIAIKTQIREQYGGETMTTHIKQDCKILDTQYHSKPLIVGSNRGNFFRVRLRNHTESISTIQAKALADTITQTQNTGIPNYYGKQRFGPITRSWKLARDLIREPPQDRRVNHIGLSAYGCLIFNEYLETRRKQQGNQIITLPQDRLLTDTNRNTATLLLPQSHHINTTTKNIVQTKKDEKKDCGKLNNKTNKVVQCGTQERKQEDKQEKRKNGGQEYKQEGKQGLPSGPILGRETINTLQESKKTAQERVGLTHYPTLHQYRETPIESLRHYDFKGHRRPLIAYPKQLNYTIEDNGDLLIDFWLPTGSFATVLVGQILAQLDNKSLESNKLVIPTIPKIS